MSKLDRKMDRIAAVLEWNLVTPLSSKFTGIDKLDLLSKKYRPKLKMKFEEHEVKFWVNEDETIRYKSNNGVSGDVETFEQFVDFVFSKICYQKSDIDGAKFSLKFLGNKCKFHVNSNYVISYRFVKGNDLHTGDFDKSFIEFYKKMLEEM